MNTANRLQGMIEWFMCGLSRERPGVQISNRSKLTVLQMPGTVSTSMQVAEQPLRYVAEMSTANSLHASVHNRASIIKGLVLL